MILICPGDVLTFDPPKKLDGRLVVKLEVEGVFDPEVSIHQGEPQVMGMATPLFGRKRRPVNVSPTEIAPDAVVSASRNSVSET